MIDVAEKPQIFKVFDRLNIQYEKEEIRIPSACPNVPIRMEDGELRCILKTDFEYLIGCSVDGDREFPETDDISCTQCEKRSERIGDFTNEHRSFIVERKRVDDYYMSMADGRLYDQARKMYKWCTGIKAVILEGMGTHEFITDAVNVFEDFDKEQEHMKSLSPIEQVIQAHPTKEAWIWESIEDLASCGVVLIQSKDLEETAKMVEQISKGSGTDPKIRSTPKKIAGLSLEEKMLTVIPRVGKVRAQNMIKEFGSLKKLISNIRKMPKKEANKKAITKILKEIFG